MVNMDAVALTIAGSDPSGGAGLQADLKVFQQLGVYGMSVVTLLTVQNTQGVTEVDVFSPEIILAQLQAVCSDIPPKVIKTGAMGNARVVEEVGKVLSGITCPKVIDPVLVSKHGHALVADDVIGSYIEHLIPQAFLITPNRHEAERLSGVKIVDRSTALEAIRQLQRFGASNVLLKAGCMENQQYHFLAMGSDVEEIVTPTILANNTHGSGCVLAASIAAWLALGELGLENAVRRGVEGVYQAIQCNSQLGKGIHPVDVRGMSQQTI